MEICIIDCKNIIYVIIFGLWFNVMGIVCAYIKMYGCDGMWKCNSGNLCMQIITRNVIILVMILVFCVAYVFLGSEKAFEHFSFASTVTSIVLSLLAIILTLNSEAKNESIKGLIDDSLFHITKNTSKLEEYDKKFDEIKPLLEKILEYTSNTNNIVKNEQFKNGVSSDYLFGFKR